MLTALLVDNDSTTSGLLSEILQSANISLEAVATGQEAVDLFLKKRHNLVFLALELPDCDGFPILRKIKEMKWFTDVTILSANGEFDAVCEAMKNFANGFLIKPLQTEKAASAVREAMERVEVYRRLEERCNNVYKKVDEELQVMSHESKDIILAAKQSISIAQVQFEKENRESGIHYLNNAKEILDISLNKIKEVIDFGLRSNDLEKGNAVKEFDIVKTIAKCHEEFRVISKSKGVSVTFKSELTSFPFFGSESSIYYMLSNLLHNALKYNRSGGTIDVSFQFKKGETELSCALIVVRDSGKGIVQERLPHIYEKWNRAGEEESEGFGFGLYFVKKIVDLHNGNILVSSEPGKGTAFTVQLPVV